MGKEYMDTAVATRRRGEVVCTNPAALNRSCIVAPPSARVMEKAGMLYEGTLRQREFIKGAYRDTKIYSILKSEFSRR